MLNNCKRWIGSNRGGGVGVEGMGWVWPETLYHRDDALLYVAYVMLI